MRAPQQALCRMRLVVDTNVVVSAFLWQGVPGRLLEMAGEKEVRLFTTRALLDELADVLGRQKLAKNVVATGLTASQMLMNYRKVVPLVTARQLPQQVSPDKDDDAVLTAAQAAKADLIVSGDRKHLLALKRFEGISIVTAAQAVAMIEAG
jgi:putative PIN family toxin of toxin-antitoxin system